VIEFAIAFSIILYAIGKLAINLALAYAVKKKAD
jgi:hypothetical protein